MLDVALPVHWPPLPLPSLRKIVAKAFGESFFARIVSDASITAQVNSSRYGIVKTLPPTGPLFHEVVWDRHPSLRDEADTRQGHGHCLQEGLDVRNGIIQDRTTKLTGRTETPKQAAPGRRAGQVWQSCYFMIAAIPAAATSLS